MSDTKTTRRDAARAVGLFLGTTQGRELFRRNHYLNDTRILAVPESEPIDSVIADHLDHGADTIVAVFFPDRRGSKRFGFFRWEMPSKQAPEGWSTAGGVTLGTGPQGHASSIGAVMDTMKAQRFTLSDDGPHDDVPDVSALLKRMSSQAFAAS